MPEGADQFNLIQEKLIEAFGSFQVDEGMHFASMKDTEEDRATVEYLVDCAHQAGLNTKQIYMEDIGTDENGLFVDADGVAIHWLFKLYPWEFMWRDSFAPLLPKSDTTFVEPPWKMVLSNKGMLPLLWERHNGHPNPRHASFRHLTKAPPCND